MKKYFKMLLSMVVAVMMVASLVACGGGDDEEVVEEEVVEEEVVEEEVPEEDEEEVEEEEEEEEEVEEEADGAVSDETWTDLQEVHANVIDMINASNKLYEAGQIDDPEYPSIMNEVADAVNQLSETQRQDWSEKDAVDMIVKYGEFAEALEKYIGE